MKRKVKPKTQMEKVTEGYEAFIQGKELNAEGKALFNKTIKTATLCKKRIKRK